MYIGSAALFRFPLTRNLLPNFHPTHTLSLIHIFSTLEDKALGCTQKCGKAYVDGVMGYGDRLKVKGLNLLSAPGNDLVAATALASSGCHMAVSYTHLDVYKRQI